MKHVLRMSTIIILAISFLCVGGAFYDLATKNYMYQPLFWPLATGFSTAGGTILIGLILKHTLPTDIIQELLYIKGHKI